MAMSDVEISIISMPHGISRWNLVTSFMKLRKEVFIQRKQWSLISHEEVEFEQYDTLAHATYVVAHVDDQVIAGCRLIRCDLRTGFSDGGFDYTYMINDAFNGLIDLPRGICDVAPPTTDDHWELTRLGAKKGNRKAVLRVMRAAYQFLASSGAVGCLCLASPAIQRIAHISGFDTKALGPICGAEDEDKFLAFEIAIKPHPPELGRQ